METKKLTIIKKILVAEDDEFSYKLLEAWCVKRNLELVHATDGMEAVKICKDDNEIDAVLMDIMLPEIDGGEATKQIKQFKPDLPIIATTAYALPKEIEKYMSFGFDAYLTKPLSSGKLFETLDKFCNNNFVLMDKKLQRRHLA